MGRQHRNYTKTETRRRTGALDGQSNAQRRCEPVEALDGAADLEPRAQEDVHGAADLDRHLLLRGLAVRHVEVVVGLDAGAGVVRRAGLGVAGAPLRGAGVREAQGGGTHHHVVLGHALRARHVAGLDAAAARTGALQEKRASQLGALTCDASTLTSLLGGLGSVFRSSGLDRAGE